MNTLGKMMGTCGDCAVACWFTSNTTEDVDVGGHHADTCRRVRIFNDIQRYRRAKRSVQKLVQEEFKHSIYSSMRCHQTCCWKIPSFSSMIFPLIIPGRDPKRCEG